MLRRKQQKFTYPSFVIQNGSPLSQRSSYLVSRAETTATFMTQCGCHSHNSDPACELVAPHKLPRRGQTKKYIYMYVKKIQHGVGWGAGRSSRQRGHMYTCSWFTSLYGRKITPTFSKGAFLPEWMSICSLVIEI